jgi:hypothetical protein
VVVRICEEENRLWSWVVASYVMDSEGQKTSRGDEGEDTHTSTSEQSARASCYVSSYISSGEPFVSLCTRFLVLFDLV